MLATWLRVGDLNTLRLKFGVVGSRSTHRSQLGRDPDPPTVASLKFKVVLPCGACLRRFGKIKKGVLRFYKHFSLVERACGALESSKKAIPKKYFMYPDSLSMYSPFWVMYPRLKEVSHEVDYCRGWSANWIYFMRRQGTRIGIVSFAYEFFMT